MGDIERRPPIFMGSLFLGYPARQTKPYDYRPALGSASQLGLYTGLAGTIAGAINHGVISPSEANRGYIGNVAKFGAMAAAIGFTFGGVSQSMASIREHNDPWNATAAGCASGFLLGLRAGQLSTALGQCAIWGGVAGGVNYAGDTLMPAHHGKSREQQQQNESNCWEVKKIPFCSIVHDIWCLSSFCPTS